MKYANTRMDGDSEVVVVVLPLSEVPGFDPGNPPQVNTYGVVDDVQVGWVKQMDGSFAPPVMTADEARKMIISAIDAEERKSMLPRVTREFMLAYMETVATPEQLALNIGYTKVKDFDNHIATLRSQL
jgi:hypothetical protein